MTASSGGGGPVAARGSSSSGMLVARTSTREQAADLPAVVSELLTPFRAVLEEFQALGPYVLPLDPAAQAVIDWYGKLMNLVEGELSTYIKAYADKCDLLEDQLLSTRLHFHRAMEQRGRRL